MSVQQEIYRSQSLGPPLAQIFTPPKTPPQDAEINVKIIHPWPEPETEAEETSCSKRRKIDNVIDTILAEVEEFNVPIRKSSYCTPQNKAMPTPRNSQYIF